MAAVAMTLLAGCAADPIVQQQRDEFSVMLELEELDGVVIAISPEQVQVDLERSVDEVVETALGVRDVLVAAMERIPDLHVSKMEIFDVRPGDWDVRTLFRIYELDDPTLSTKWQRGRV